MHSHPVRRKGEKPERGKGEAEREAEKIEMERKTFQIERTKRTASMREEGREKKQERKENTVTTTF